MNMEKAKELLERELRNDNERQRNLVWYKRCEDLLSTGMHDLVALKVWNMINESQGFKYEHVALSSLRSLALAIQDRHGGKK